MLAALLYSFPDFNIKIALCYAFELKFWKKKYLFCYGCPLPLMIHSALGLTLYTVNMCVLWSKHRSPGKNKQEQVI